MARLTSDIDRAMRFARDIQAGYVMINDHFTGGPGSPFGGCKQSGIGRERGLLALQNYTHVKNVVVRVGRSSPDRRAWSDELRGGAQDSWILMRDKEAREHHASLDSEDSELWC